MRRAFEDEPEGDAVADPLALLVRSNASPGALPLVRRFTATEFIAPLAERLEGAGASRAALVTACLIGIRIFRDVLAVEAMNDTARSGLEPLIADLFTAILYGRSENAPT